MPNDRHAELLEKLFHDLARKNEEDRRELMAKMDQNHERLSDQIQDLREEVKLEISGLRIDVDQVTDKIGDHDRTLGVIKKVSGVAGLSVVTSLCGWVFGILTGIFPSAHGK